MVRVPTTSEEMERLACPAAPSGRAPSAVVPSKKVTVPVGVTPGPPAVAVKVTACPNTEGFVAVATETVETAGVTTCFPDVDAAR